MYDNCNCHNTNAASRETPSNLNLYSKHNFLKKLLCWAVIALVLVSTLSLVFEFKERSHIFTLGYYDRHKRQQVPQPPTLNRQYHLQDISDEIEWSNSDEVKIIVEAKLEPEAERKAIERARNEEPEQTVVSNRSRAVMHIGPHKTGTTSIQLKSALFGEELEKDNYEMPWVYVDPTTRKKLFPDSNQVHFARCFIPSGIEKHRERKNKERFERFECVQELLDAGEKIAERNGNLFVTAEAFDDENIDIESLVEYLSRWDDVTIIVYYRRYYDWLHSSFNQNHRLMHLHLGKDDNQTKSNDSLVTFLDKRDSNETNYIHQVLQRYKKHFDNVLVVNYHDKSKGLTEAFYCDHIPGANHTCKALQTNYEVINANPSQPINYMNLAYGAHKRGLINIKGNHHMKLLLAAVQRYQEETLGLTMYDFKLNCPSRQVLLSLLDLSLERERTLFPHLFESPSYEKGMRFDFETQARTKLCDINIEVTLMMEEWATFFKLFDEGIYLYQRI